MSGSKHEYEEGKNPCPECVKEGDFFLTNEGCDVIVLYYKNSKNVWVEFLDSFGHRCKVESKQLTLGTIKNPYHKSVKGVGYLGVGKYRCSIKGVLTREYVAWSSAMSRSYSLATKSRNTNYKDCTVHPDWHNFQNFAEWYVKQKGYGLGYELDKDLLEEGNKEYSAVTCCLVPKEINNFLVLRKNDRGEHPLGVRYNKNTKSFLSRIQVGGKRVELGNFSDSDEAFKVYKKNKEFLASLLAYKYESTIDERVFKYLLKFKVTDKR